MKKLVSKLFFWLLIILLLHLLILFFFADGYFDSNYKRFTTPRNGSLILGTSRSAQGIVPSILIENLCLYNPIINFSFNIGESPFGPVYLHAIENKLDANLNNNIYIITVDPWSLSIHESNTSDNYELYREANRCLGNTKSFDLRFNYNYLLNNIHTGWGQIFIRSMKTRLIKTILNLNLSPKYFNYFPNGYSYLHNDGWLEVTLKSDSDFFLNKRTMDKVDYFKDNWLYHYRISKNRFNYLNDTIELLDLYGEVLLVRMPVHEDILEIEDQYCPHFNEIMQNFADEKDLVYYNYTGMGNNYKYTDGNHLIKFSAKAFSLLLAQDIKD